MKKQQIVLIVVVVIIFAGLIYLGVRQTPKSQPIVNNQPIENNALQSAQSVPLEPSEVPEEAIKISITEQGITPASFEAKAGQEVMLSVSSADQWTHIFKFKLDALKDVAVGVGPQETRVISFMAPKAKGEYEYYCAVPGHIERGEKGIMIIK